jgi:hypothetical protein
MLGSLSFSFSSSSSFLDLVRLLDFAWSIMTVPGQLQMVVSFLHLVIPVLMW